MVRCLTGIKFTMNAEVLKPVGITEGDPVLDSTAGMWQTTQDPITLEVRYEWVPNTATPDNPDTVPNEFVPETIDCLARGVMSSGVALTGTGERFGEFYQSLEYVRLWVPASVIITKRDRVTNIREKRGGKVVWVDEEFGGGTRATVFNVTGSTPLFDPFNKHTQNLVYLERADL